MMKFLTLNNVILLFLLTIISFPVLHGFGEIQTKSTKSGALYAWGKNKLNKEHCKKILGDSLSLDEVSKYINSARGASSHSIEKGRYHIKGGIDNSALCRWSDLDKDLVSVIEILNSDVMRYFGYKKTTSKRTSNYLDIMRNIGIRTTIVFFISKVFFILSKLISILRRANIKRY